MSGPRSFRLLSLAATLFLALSATAQEIDVQLDRFGVGNVFRPGDWTAARFIVLMRSGEPRSVQLVWEVENADGDIAEHVRTLVLNPGQPAKRWLSAELPPRVDVGSVFAVRVFEDNDGRRG